MRLQNIIESISPAVMAKVEAVIAKHDKAIEAEILNDKIIMLKKSCMELFEERKKLAMLGCGEDVLLDTQSLLRDYNDSMSSLIEHSVDVSALNGFRNEAPRCSAENSIDTATFGCRNRMQNMGMNGPTGGAFGSILGGCL